MKVSIQTKLLLLCIFLVLLTTISVSTTYYVLTKRDKHRESQQRIKIAFDIIFHDLDNRLNTNIARFDDFLREDATIQGLVQLYNRDAKQMGSVSFLGALSGVTSQLRRFGRGVSINQLTLYGGDQRLLGVYQRTEAEEEIGMYLITQTGNDTYVSSDAAAKIVALEDVPEVPLPAGIAASFAGEILDTITGSVVRKDNLIGIRIVAPLQYLKKKAGVLVGETFYTQTMVEQYALLSETAINFFAGPQWSIGTLPAQAQLEQETMQRLLPCQDFLSGKGDIEIAPLTFARQDYYQGGCALQDQQGTIGAITVSLSQAIEQQAITKILTSVLTISAIIMGVAIGLSVISSRKSVRFLQQVITAIGRISRGDIPDKITENYKGEFHDIKQNLNGLIDALNEVTRLAEEIAAGNLNVAVHKRSDQDTLMQTLAVMVASLQEVTRMANDIASGNLTVEVRQRSSQDALMQALAMMVNNLQDVVSSVQSAAANVAAGSQELRSNSEGMSQGTAHQAAATQEVSASMEQMAANIRQNAENALQTEKIAVQAAQYAEESSKVVGDAVVAMQRIAERILIIQDIAVQTRMLSLNATIEAARAQEHGKAFSVVASEVRQLSDTTRIAAEEINKLANSTVSVAENAGTMLGTLVPNIHKTAELIQEISAASNEQTMGVEQINKAMQQLDGATQQNAIVSESIASAAEELAAQAEQLRQTMAFFRIVETPYPPEVAHTPSPRAIVSPLSKSADAARTEGPRERLDHQPDTIKMIQNPSDVDKLNEDKDPGNDEFEHY